MPRDHALSGALPNTDLNSIPDLLAELLKQPELRRVAVCLVDVASIKHKVDTGTDLPTVRIRAIEFLDGDAGDEARQLLEQSYSDRTGKAELDFDAAGSDGEEDDE